MNALSFGATYWLGKTLRLSANYGINWFRIQRQARLRQGKKAHPYGARHSERKRPATP